MADEVATVEKTTYVFRTEEERITAIEGLPEDPGVGIDLEEWRKEQALELEAIQGTVLTPEGEQPSAETPSPEVTPPAETPAATVPEQPNALEGQVEYWKGQVSQIKDSYQAQLQSQATEYEEKLRVVDKPKEVAKPVFELDADIDSKLKATGDDISRLQQEMQGILTQGTALDDDKILLKQQELTQKTLELDNLRGRHQTNLLGYINEMKLESVAVENKRIAADQAAAVARETKTREDSMNQNLEAFRSQHEELKGEAYIQLEDKYRSFGKQVASVQFGVSEIEVKDHHIELAMSHFRKKTPSLMQGLESKGIKAFDGIEQFETLSNIKMAMQGYEIDDKTGLTKYITNFSGKQVNFPGFDDAANYIQRKSGALEKKNLDAASSAVANFSAATQKRAAVTELDGQHQTQNLTDMSKEEASNIVMAADDEELVNWKRVNPNNPKLILWERAAAILDIPPVPI